MKCSDFEAILGAFLKGGIAAEEREVALTHLENCSGCCQTAQIVRGDLDKKPGGSAGDFVASVLELTSGPPCDRSKRQLCDLVDGVLSPEYSKVVACHLHNCSECSALFVALTELAGTLPEMASIEPDPLFTSEVLAITSFQQEEVYRPSHPIRRFVDVLFRRPRFSWEAAYVGTLLIMAIWGSMANPAPAGEIMQILAGPHIGLHRLTERLDGHFPEQWVAEHAEKVKGKIAGGFEDRKHAAGHSIIYLRQQADELFQESSEFLQLKAGAPLNAAGAKVRELLVNIHLRNSAETGDS